jgi:hypothetical protein
MADILTIRVFKQRQKYHAQATLPDPALPPRFAFSATGDTTLDAVVNVLAKIEKKGSWKAGHRGRPPNGTSVAKRLVPPRSK